MGPTGVPALMPRPATTDRDGLRQKPTISSRFAPNELRGFSGGSVARTAGSFGPRAASGCSWHHRALVGRRTTPRKRLGVRPTAGTLSGSPHPPRTVRLQLRRARRLTESLSAYWLVHFNRRVV